MSFESLSPMMQENAKEFCIMEYSTKRDPDGGIIRYWKEGAHFDAIVAHETTIAAQTAEKQELASTYTFLIPQNVKLAFPDAVKRLEDGAIFQITTNAADRKTPNRSSMWLSSVKAQKWRLPE